MISRRILVICFVMSIAAIAAFWFIAGTVSIDGYDVPVRLTELVQRVESEGEAYQAPDQVITTCKDADSISRNTLDAIERVIGQQPSKCRFDTNAVHWDALMGASLILVITMLILIGVWLDDRESIPLNVLFITICAIALFVAGTLVGPDIWDFISNPIEEGERFWRGFFCSLCVVAGIVLAHVVDDIVDDD